MLFWPEYRQYLISGHQSNQRHLCAFQNPTGVLRKMVTPFSPLMLGTVQFGLPYGVANTHGMPTDDDVATILKEAFDAGMNSIDTSADYGSSEERLGAAMNHLGLSGRFEVVTKIPKVPDGLAESEIPTFVAAHLTRSLQRLGLEQLAAALFHAESDAVHLPHLETMIDKGYIARSGVSLDSIDHPIEAHKACCVQIPSNLLDHRFDNLIDSAPTNQQIVFARSVFLQGFLLMPEESIPLHLAPLVIYRNLLEKIAREADYSLAQLAVGYLRSQPNVTSLVMGMETVGQLRENLDLFNMPLFPPELMNRVKTAVGLLPEQLIRPSLWRKR